MFRSFNVDIFSILGVFFFQAEDGIRDLVRSRGLGDVYKRQWYIRPVAAPLNQPISVEVARSLFSESCPARVALDQLTSSTPSTLVTLTHLFGCAIRSIPQSSEAVLLFDSRITPGDFAKAVGIANAQHIGSMLKGQGGRKLSLIHISEPTRPY
eukprot:TRINITY_DN4437_c0_g1_i1.p1 TRINITY_DN4437_c0_g1~~TRINITY_DN4437_c0_g1_i1.p1  ORF type:complete len:154 (+),score=47.73 TRINITY_DN4437_c0_g1_i1:35-496(+)